MGVFRVGRAPVRGGAAHAHLVSSLFPGSKTALGSHQSGKSRRQLVTKLVQRKRNAGAARPGADKHRLGGGG